MPFPQKHNGIPKALPDQRFSANDCGLGIGKNAKKNFFRIIENLFELAQNKAKGIYLAAVKKGDSHFWHCAQDYTGA
ncbi:MAG: hypothetical protein SFV55_23880 [Haliscomenobacter sp.]|uniref:hypothetical protein n=1 Tax=Haliscomenobacter sp. TaxID=2717303 RepID=UPI0029A2FE5C|nr:hypothetical protein [Haliscomenobacter sp.]MDX2071490.1 hypothetical protein [Haliscomenobacter sp.]